MAKTKGEYEDTWDDLVKFNVINEEDEFENSEEFTDIVLSPERDPFGRISPQFIEKLVQTSGFQGQVGRTTQKRVLGQLPSPPPTKGSKLTEEEQETIFELEEIGTPRRQIGRVIGRPESTVRNFIRRIS